MSSILFRHSIRLSHSVKYSSSVVHWTKTIASLHNHHKLSLTQYRPFSHQTSSNSSSQAQSHSTDQNSLTIVEKQTAAPTPNILSRLFRPILNVLDHYNTTCKLLILQARHARKIKKKYTGFRLSNPVSSALSMTYSEYQFLRTYQEDYKVAVPFICVFLVPFVGNMAPLFALLFPKAMPTSFFTVKQTEDFLFEEMKSQRKSFKQLLKILSYKTNYPNETLSTLASHLQSYLKYWIFTYHPHSTVVSGTMNLDALNMKLDNVTDKVNDFRTSTSSFSRTIPSHDWIQYDMNYNILVQQFTLNSFSHKHLRHLVQGLCRGSVFNRFFPRKLLHTKLKKWSHYNLMEEQLIDHQGGITTLSITALINFLTQRGLFLHAPQQAKFLALYQQELLKISTQLSWLQTVGLSSAQNISLPFPCPDGNQLQTQQALEQRLVTEVGITPEMIADWRQLGEEWMTCASMGFLPNQTHSLAERTFQDMTVLAAHQGFFLVRQWEFNKSNQKSE